MDMDQAARKAVEKNGSCCDGCELFRITKELGKARYRGKLS